MARVRRRPADPDEGKTVTVSSPNIDGFTIKPPEVSSAVVVSALRRTLAGGLVGSVAVAGQSTVHAKSVYVAPTADLRFWFFLTSPESTWAKLSQPGCSAALTLAPTDQPWGDPHVGLQVAAELIDVDVAGSNLARESYREAFPDSLEMLEAVAVETTSLAMFALRTVRLTVIDTAAIPDERCELHPGEC